MLWSLLIVAVACQRESVYLAPLNAAHRLMELHQKSEYMFETLEAVLPSLTIVKNFHFKMALDSLRWLTSYNEKMLLNAACKKFDLERRFNCAKVQFDFKVRVCIMTDTCSEEDRSLITEIMHSNQDVTFYDRSEL